MDTIIFSLLDRARHNQSAARLSLENGFYSATIELAFFSAFYAGSAAVIANGTRPGDRLDPEFVKPHLLPAEYAQSYTRLAGFHQSITFGLESPPTRESAEAFLAETRQFLDSMRMLIMSLGSHASSQGLA